MSTKLTTEGETLFAAGNLEEARDRFLAAVEADPQDKEALNNLGVIAFQENRIDRAAAYFSQCISIDPFYVEAVLNFCDLLKATGHIGRAANLLSMAAARYPDNEELKQLLDEAQSSQTVAGATETTPAAEETVARSGVKPRPSILSGLAEPTRAPYDISLRRFPYPYRAGFSIANDIDHTSWEDFKAIFSYLCTDRPTTIGRGLALPLSSSFFLFKPPDRELFAYFDSLEGGDGPHREEIEQLIRCGFLDNIHGFGTFSNSTPFRREYAQLAYDILAERGLQAPIWSNHGGQQDIQQVDSTGEVAYALGDDPNSPAYHFDLTLQYGVRWIWEWHGGGLTDVIGLDGAGYSRYGDKLFIPQAAAGHRKYQPFDRNDETLALLDQRYRLLSPVTFKDGSKTYKLRRFNGGDIRPTASNLDVQITRPTLSELIQNEGYMVLYQHLGCQEGPNDIAVTNRPPYFSKSVRARLEHLASLYHDGYLFVAPLAQLLEHCYLARHLVYTSEHVGDRYRIDITGIKDDFLENHLPIEAGRLGGLTFYTPEPEHTDVYVDGTQLDPLVINPPDHRGKSSISLGEPRRVCFDID